MGDKKNHSQTKKGAMTRRQFIRDTTAAAIGSTILLGQPVPAFTDEAQKSRSVKVVLIRDNRVLDINGNPKAEVVQQMIDQAVVELTGQKDPVEAFKTFIKPSDVVGIKTNAWMPICTPSQVEQALKKRVMDVGVRESDIEIADRQVLRSPVFQKATALINARPMRTHHWSGVGSLIKNYVMFVPVPREYHNDSCADLGKIWHLPLVKDKTRLNVLVMLTPQFHGVGPHGFSPRYVWSYYGILAGFDPVAVDSVGVRIIEARRQEFFKEERPLNPPPKHIFLADTRYHLGTADPTQINLVKIGYEQDGLI